MIGSNGDGNMGGSTMSDRYTNHSKRIAFLKQTPLMIVAAILAVILFRGTVRSADKATAKKSVYVDANYGFSLTPPRFKTATPGSMVVPAIFSGIGDGSFTSNVNINVNVMTTTREQYRKLSLDEFRAANLKVIADTDRTVSGRNAILFSYEGRIQETDLHFLALAIIDMDRVILVTCTAKQAVFKEMEAEFLACLNSFKLD